MGTIFQRFSEHPASLGETYGRHCRQAWRFGARMVVAGIACMVHGLCPFLFTHTASDALGHLNDEIRRGRR